MSFHFRLDGSIGTLPEPSKQKQLEDRLFNFETNKKERLSDLRLYRNFKLNTTDWMILPDSPIPVGIQSSWREYRQNLRDLPNHNNAPDRFSISEWPLEPGQTEIPEEAKIFIAEISDPLGIGTTSWVGIGTDGEYVEQPMPQPEPEVIPEPTSDSEE